MFLKEKTADGVESSMLRLFPRFAEADDPRWDRVITQARGGAENALDILGHKDAPEKNPVCAEVLRPDRIGTDRQGHPRNFGRRPLRVAARCGGWGFDGPAPHGTCAGKL